MSKSHQGSKNRKQTDTDGDWQGVPGVREMTEIKQQDHGDVFYHKQHIGEQLKCLYPSNSPSNDKSSRSQ